MALELGSRMRFLKQSEIRNMTLECTRLGGINLSQGVCDTPVPEAVQRAAQAAIAEGFNTYTRYDGLAELRSALSDKLRTHNELEYAADGEIIVTCGATGAFYGACAALLDPGDEVLVPVPTYPLYTAVLAKLGAETVYYRTDLGR